MYITIFALLFIAHSNGVNIDPKLDFSDSGEKPTSDFANSEVLLPKRANNSDIFENINVECTSGGCNATSKNESRSENDISANIIVRIQANTNFGSNRNNSVIANTAEDDVPDIPIVLGYGGLTESEKNEINSRKQTVPPESIFEPAYDAVVPLQTNNAGRGRSFFKENDDRIHYFQSTENNKNGYYGQETPLAMLIYPKRLNGWTSTLPVRNQVYQYPTTSGFNTCTCPNHTPRAHWYPSRNYEQPPVISPGNQNPGAQVNDKLEPLN